MKTKKSKDIPDADWANAPDITAWQEAAAKAREEWAKKQLEKINKPKTLAPTLAPKLDFVTLTPRNSNFMEHFNLAKNLQMVDVGETDNCILVTFDSGVLSIDFIDKTLEILPHDSGRVIDYHILVPQKLSSLYCLKPNDEDAGLSSCIFVLAGENRTFEYLITPRFDSTTFSFELEFHHA